MWNMHEGIDSSMQARNGALVAVREIEVLFASDRERNNVPASLA